MSPSLASSSRRLSSAVWDTDRVSPPLKLAEVASAEATQVSGFDASVTHTSAPSRQWLTESGFIDRCRELASVIDTSYNSLSPFRKQCSRLPMVDVAESGKPLLSFK